MLPESRKNADEVTRLAKAKEIRSTFNVAASKVRAIVSCDVCNAPRFIFSMKASGGPNVPSKLRAFELDRSTESGYACVNGVTVQGFYAQWKLSCGDSVEINYYNPSVGTKGGTIVTKTVCSVFYLDENNVDKVELLKRPETVGVNPLPL